MNKKFINPNSNERYRYTKFIVPIMLLESPSDYEDCHYYLDINYSDFCQTDCYIGACKIENNRKMG